MNNGPLESCLPMQSVSDFIAGYTHANRQRIAFACNGKHAADIRDMRVVRPRWHHKAWARLAGLWRRL